MITNSFLIAINIPLRKHVTLREVKMGCESHFMLTSNVPYRDQVIMVVLS